MINVKMLENNVDDSFREKLEQFVEFICVWRHI